MMHLEYLDQILHNYLFRLFTVLRESRARLFTVDEDFILIVQFLQCLISGGELKQKDINVLGKLPRDIRNRLQSLRTLPTIQGLLPNECDVAEVLAENLDLPDVLHIALRAADHHAFISEMNNRMRNPLTNALPTEYMDCTPHPSFLFSFIYLPTSPSPLLPPSLIFLSFLLYLFTTYLQKKVIKAPFIST